jgi:hypothetical protein
MDRFLRTTLLVLGIVVLSLLLFNFGIQLYGLFSGPVLAAHGPMAGPMMGGRAGMQAFGGAGFGFLGPILGIALVGLVVAGIVALVQRGGRGSGVSNPPAE